MKHKLIPLLILSFLLVTGCQPEKAAEDNSTSTAAFDEGSRTLTICLAYEPDSLYPYAASTQAAQDVLQAIYDGPIDVIDGQVVPVILTYQPDYQDDSAKLIPVSVQAGDAVVDIYGEVTTLQKGVQILPSGCRDSSCAITWDGSAALQMDQPTASYELLPGLTWSDGKPLTAVDSVFSFQLAADAATPGDKTSIERTSSYTAADETTVKWIGLPGLFIDQFEDYFWMPLPEHAWGAYSAAELLASEEIAREPLGWGPYVMDEWVEGQYIRLKKNPNYFRADEGLPNFDYLIFKITDPYGDTNIANLKFDREPYAQFDYDVGEFDEDVSQNGCDLTSSTVDMNDQWEVLHILLDYFSDSAVQVRDGLGKQAQWLLFNHNSDLFSSADMRQAVSACLERSELAETVFYGLVNAPGSITLTYRDADADPNSPLLPDAGAGMALLEQNGWVEGEPRTAQSVDGFDDGAPLSINYLVSEDTLSMAVANQVKQSLGECGMQVNLISVSPEAFWDRENPESIFQGNYHLVQMEWPLPIEDPCALFDSQNIPSEGNEFTGLNFSGFSNERLDEICEDLQSVHLSDERQVLLDEIEDILDAELALMPLYESADLMVTRSDFCPADTGNSSISELSQIESFDYGQACQP